MLHNSVIKILFLTIVLLSTSCDEDDGNVFTLAAQKLTESQAQLTWSPIEGNDGYKIWRAIEDINEAPELVATVNDLQWVDGDLPLCVSLAYYITTTVNGKEEKSTIAQVAGGSTLLILPYQMQLIPGKNLAVVRDYSSMILLDYHRKIIVKRVNFNGRVGQFDMHTNQGALEVYVPCSDKNLYILKADDFAPTDTIKASTPLFSAVVNSSGKIFCSGGDYSAPITVYDQNGQVLSTLSGDMDSGLGFQDDTHLIAISTHLSPATMSYYTVDSDGAFFDKKDDPYHYDYEMDGNRLKVSSKYVVTSTYGSVYKADENLTFVKKLSSSYNMTDFEFSEDGSTIYCAQTDSPSLLKATITNNTVLTSVIPTNGYPWVLARSGNTLVILSSPVAFSPSFQTNSVIVEQVNVQ